MNAIERLQALASQMELEPDSPSLSGVGYSMERAACQSIASLPQKQRDEIFVHPAQLPNGQKILLLKTLLSSACERDCFYCPFRAGRDFRRVAFKPEEFARTFMSVHQAKAAQGLFLSSGIAGGGTRTQDQLLDAADILRNKLKFRGYIHLKIMPGAQKAQVERAMQLADRVSVNLEAPNTERLARLAPHKQFLEELIRPLRWAEEIRKTQPAHKGWNGRWPSTVTQFVAGGSDESDLELLSTTQWLNKHASLKRAYFSAFHPVPDTPLENKPATDPLREHRLYQASFLMRDYGFDIEELPFTNNSNLPLASDPKLAWARVHLSESPLEINRAERSQLLRVPGIGLKGVESILKARRIQKLRDPSALKKLGVIAERAAPYLLFDGHRAAMQMELIGI